MMQGNDLEKEKTKDGKNVVLYIRAEEETKVNEQEARLKAYVKEHPGWVIRKEFIDRGIYNKKRLALKELDAEIKERQYDIVLTVSGDRISRDMDFIIKTLSAWRECGVTVVTPNSNLREGETL